MFDEVKEVKYFIEITDAYLEAKQASMIQLLCKYT